MQVNIKKSIALIAMVLSVTACGGGSSDSNDGSEIQDANLTINTMNINNSQTVAEAENVGLQSIVTTTEGKTAYINKVVPLNDYTRNHCTSDYQSLDLNIKSTEVGVCAYQYTVALAEDSNVTSTAMNFTSVQGVNGGSSISLTPISLALDMGEVLTLDLQSELGSDYPTNAVIDDDSIIIVGDQTTAVTTNTATNEITVTAGSEVGHTRVYYTMTDATAGLVEQGVIDVAVNDTLNQAPTAEDFQLSQAVQSEATVTIDVADHIDDPDGDTLKLVDVLTFNAQVKILEDTDPDFTNYTSFEFTAMGLGERVITYVVEDQLGGYAVGNVTLNLTGGIGEVEISWSDITLSDGTTFTAPLSTEFASLLKVEYSADYTETAETGPEGYKIALMTYQEAEEFCASKSARLPMPSELLALKQAEGNTASSNLFDNQSWPIGRAYWSALSASETEALTYDFYARDTGTLDNTLDHANVTCVLLSDTVLDFNMERLSADSRVDEVTTYSTTVTDPDGDPAAYKQVYISSKGQNGNFDADGVSGKSLALKTDADGKISFTYTETNPVNEIIVSQFSSQELNTIYKTDDINRTTEVNVYDPTLWNRASLDGGDLTDVSQTNGLTLFNLTGTNAKETTNMYINPINAVEWEIAFTIESDAENIGLFSMYLTQVTPDEGETWEEMVKDWGKNNIDGVVMAGAPSYDDRELTYTFFAHRYQGKIGFNLANQSDYVYGQHSSLIKNLKTYYWVKRYIDESGVHNLSFYIGTSPDFKDATKVTDRSLTNYLQFNPFNDFYIGFGGKGADVTGELRVTELTISTFE